MFKYGDAGKVYGYGLYGGIDEIVWCEDEVFADGFEDVDETPLGDCAED